MKPEDVKTVGVVGCGIMGSGIVEVCARAGLAVVAVEADEERLAKGKLAVERSTAKAVERGKMQDADRQALLERVRFGTDLRDFAEVDLVVEAVTEDYRMKVDIFRRVDELTRPDIVLASNTSSIPITDLAAATKRPDRVIGMHFFNPPPVMKLLEVVRALTTSDETLAFAQAMGERLGKTTVVSKDRAGFIVNMLLVPYLNGAVRMVEEGFATPKDVDTAIELGLSHPIGPLALLDFIGLDTAMHVADVLYEEFKEPNYAPPALLKRMVAAGHLGRKSGKGFYDYQR